MINSLVKKVLLWKQKELKVLYVGDQELNADGDYSCISNVNDENYTDNSLEYRRDINRINEATKFHAEWIRQRKVSIKSPFSNKTIEAIDCYTPYIDTYHCILYKFYDQNAFYLIVGDYWFEKIGIYIPYKNLIVLKRQININVKEMLSLFIIKNTFRRNSTPIGNKELSIVLYHDHIAHHIMNELNGIQGLIEQGLIYHIDRIYYCNLPYGNIKTIFPEIPSNKFHKISRYITNKKLDRGGLLLMPYQTAEIYDGTISRLKKHQETKIGIHTKNTINRLIEQYDIRIWCSIRTDNRIMTNHISLLNKITERIEEEGKSVLLILDGYSKAYESSEREVGHYLKIIGNEKQQVEQIKNQGLEYIDLISRPIQETLSYTAAANCYLCHSGTLHHKISWFCDIPGIIHSNEHFSELADNLLPGMTEKKWTYIPQRVPQEYVEDLNTISHSRNGDILPKKFSNYKVDTEGVKNQFMRLLKDNGLMSH